MNTSVPDPTLQRLQQIGELIDSGDLASAAAQLDAVAQTAADDPRVYLLGARAAEAAARPEAAVDYLHHAMGLSPEWEVPATEMALLLARLNQPDEALKAAQWAVALAPDSLDVLYRVVDVAHAALDAQQALAWLEHAAALDPDNLPLKALIARDLAQTGQYPQAIAAYTALVADAPADGELRLGRAKAALAAGQPELARTDCAMLVAQDAGNATYRFWHQVAHGEVPATQPAAMTQALFDSYAAQFDTHLVEGLQYKVPEQVAALVSARYSPLRLDLLDLGCGTGLLAKALQATDGRRVGVDLSPKMLEQAKRLALYDELHCGELVAFLHATGTAQFDVVAACDVFIYSGDLTEVIPQAARVLRRGGHLVFSCETAREDEADLVLRASTRYAHKASHVQALCAAAGLSPVALEPTTIRVESGAPIEGYIVVVHKPG